MNNLEDILASSKDFKSYAQAYIEHLFDVLQNLDKEALLNFEREIELVKESGTRMFIAGNGGSSATASHITNDFGMLNQKGQKLTGKPFKLIELTDNMPIITAIANDFGYDDIFSRQLELNYQPGDSLLVISASGNSENLVRAATFVKNKGGKVYGFLGFDGGKLHTMCDVSIIAKTAKGEYGPVEDVHMILDHLFYSWFHHKTFRNAN